MPRTDPSLLPVVIDLERGLRELGVPFGLVGALVPELLLSVPPHRRTNDVDVVAVVATIHDFEALKGTPRSLRFCSHARATSIEHRDGGRLDILPVDRNAAPGGRLSLGDGFELNMAGFDRVVPNAIEVSVEGGPILPVAPLPLYVLLKLVAFTDRKASKDLGSVLRCLEHYLDDDGRRYGVDHEGAGVPFEYTGRTCSASTGGPFSTRHSVQLHQPAQAM